MHYYYYHCLSHVFAARQHCSTRADGHLRLGMHLLNDNALNIHFRSDVFRRLLCRFGTTLVHSRPGCCDALPLEKHMHAREVLYL